MRIKDLTNAPQWLIEAIVENEDVEIDQWGGVVWRGGVWRGGVWRGGVWCGGVWRGGVWCGGVWCGGEWCGGEWCGGVWCGGVWRGGEWCGGEWCGGEWRGGEWCGGEWRGEKLTKPLLALIGLTWPVVISGTRMQIGCELHAFAEWAGFDDARIVTMDRQALRFWRENKAALLALCDARRVPETESAP